MLTKTQQNICQTHYTKPLIQALSGVTTAISSKRSKLPFFTKHFRSWTLQLIITAFQWINLTLFSGLFKPSKHPPVRTELEGSVCAELWCGRAVSIFDISARCPHAIPKGSGFLWCFFLHHGNGSIFWGRPHNSCGHTMYFSTQGENGWQYVMRHGYFRNNRLTISYKRSYCTRCGTPGNLTILRFSKLIFTPIFDE